MRHAGWILLNSCRNTRPCAAACSRYERFRLENNGQNVKDGQTSKGRMRHAQAQCDGIVAIGHYRRFSRPSTGTVGIWLDDLFTTTEARGKGAARALIHRLAEIAGSEGRSVVRWITADDNHRAQALYDKVATRTHWVTYDAAPATA